MQTATQMLALADRAIASQGMEYLISYHQYLVERTNATVQIVQVDPDGITLTLACKANPIYNDLPLTPAVNSELGEQEIPTHAH